MKRKYLIKKIFILILLVISLMAFSSCNKKEGGTKFSFASYKTVDDVNYNIYFEESYFDSPASNYNPHLASASACLALAGFSAASSTDFTVSDKNAKKLFKNLGFENYLPNDYGISKPTDKSFGVYIASKKIKDYTLIGITVRGAGYLTEWASNFNIGNNDEFAQGFFEASEIYLNFLKEYINKFNITGHIKIWTAGYSRGGATVNLAAGRIDDGLAENINILSSNVNYDKDDIYAYSFEPPAGKIVSADEEEIKVKNENYSNIYSILNLNDPVPFVAPKNYMFVRYGNDLFLPDIITDLNYNNQINLVKKRMTKLSNYNVVGDYKIDKFIDESTIKFLNKKESNYINATPYLYLNDLIDTICDVVGGKDNYVNYLQDTITELFKFIYSNLSPKESVITLVINMGKYLLSDDADEIVLYDLEYNPKRFISDLEPLLLKAFKRIDVNITMTDVKKLTAKALDVFVKILFRENGFNVLRAMINIDNVAVLGSAHIPELLLTHITSLDDNYESSGLELTNSFNIIHVESNDEFNLNINNEKYVYFENGKIVSKLAIKKINGGYDIYMPSNVSFNLGTSGSLDYKFYNHNNRYLHDKLFKEGKLNNGGVGYAI